MSESDQTGQEGVAFGPYRVYQRIGVGGMATVHRAKEIGIEGFERWVALKRLLPHLAEDASFVRSFVREAKLASLLAHPSIVQIYELGRVGHVYFISMELIEGFDVRHILRQARRVTGPPPIAVTVAILSQICDALEYAHSRVDDSGEPLGLVHRDVSPSNVIVARGGHLKIIDFGIAKAQIQQLQTHTGRVKGKMAYMSPEAIRGLQIDGRSDLFSLGVLAHELLTARPLFATKNDYKTLQRVQNATIAPPSTFNRECPAELDAIVLRALERDRDERWQTAGEMLNELVELRQQYQLSCQPRDVADWIAHAFSSDAVPLRSTAGTTSRSVVQTPSPETGAPSIVIEPPALTGLRTPITGPTGPSQMPVGNVALPVAEDDDEIVEIAWGGRSSHTGVVLEEVPDVSSRGIAAAGMTPVPTHPSRTLVAPAPPPPERKHNEPRHWASGTKPPGAEDELRLDRFPLIESSDEAPRSMKRPGSVAGVPRVRFRKRAETTGSVPVRAPSPLPLLVAAPAPTTPAPAAAAPTVVAPTPAPNRLPRRPQTTHRTGGATSIGASIVDRGSSLGVRLGVAAAALAVIGVVALLLLRGGGGDDPRSTIKLIVEPSDAKVKVDGAGALTGSPAVTRLAPGTYAVSVERDGYKTWSSKLEVVASENQTLRIVLAPDASEAVSELVEKTESRADQPAAAAAAPVTREREASDERDSSHREHRSHAPVLEQPEQPMIADEPAPAPDMLPRGVDVPLALGTIEPPAPKLKPKKRNQPLVVPPTAVHKQSGSVPRLRDRNGSLPSRMAAELCIDFRGVVKSARLINDVPKKIKRQLETALRDWRYDPYRVDGERVDACFAVSFSTR